MIRLVAVLIVVLVCIGSSRPHPVNTNINTNTNNNYNSNLATIYLFQAILKLSEIISGLERSGVLKGHQIPAFPIPIDSIRALVQEKLLEMEKPDPVKEALDSTDSLQSVAAQSNDQIDEDEVAAFQRLVGDKFGGKQTDSEEFRGTLEKAMAAFKGRPVPPLSGSEW